MSRRVKCACGKAAKFLCDALLVDRTERALRRLKGDDSSTCDAPLCAGCRVDMGAPSFFCGGAPPGLQVDSHDRCPKHAPAGRVERARDE